MTPKAPLGEGFCAPELDPQALVACGMDIQPFALTVDEAVLDDLRDRLRRTRWPERPAGGGMDRDALKRLVGRWADGFDWRAQEARLNAYPQFTARIDGASLHFVHVRSGREDSPALILMTGWPSNFAESLPLVDRLRDDFHLIVPSLPGFGFSEALGDGFSMSGTADRLARLMTELGYPRFGAHGTDIGAGVALALGARHTDRVWGVHTANVYWAYPRPDDLTEEEEAWLKQGEGWFMGEGAYAHVQSTKPQSLDVGLNDSPAGLAAWILEKFETWSDGGVAAYDPDNLLTILSVYWFSGSIAPSFMAYEGQAEPEPSVVQRNPAPAGVFIAPAEITPAPRRWGERWLDLRRWTEASKGGHFPSLEVPDLLAEDLRAFHRDVT